MTFPLQSPGMYGPFSNLESTTSYFFLKGSLHIIRTSLTRSVVSFHRGRKGGLFAKDPAPLGVVAGQVLPARDHAFQPLGDLVLIMERGPSVSPPFPGLAC